MIERLLPDDAVAVETREELLEEPGYPEERAQVADAVDKRRREFLTARACAHQALRALGLPPQPIASGERGEPLWPSGVVGSITHCQGYRGCALARSETMLGVGIDAEPDEPLPGGVIEAIARPEEKPTLVALRRLAPSVHWDRLLFSAKESVYKAWFPLARRPLGFEDAIVCIELEDEIAPSRRLNEEGKRAGESARDRTGLQGRFRARLLVEGPRLGETVLAGFSGAWLAADGLLLTAIAVRDPRGGG